VLTVLAMAGMRRSRGRKAGSRVLAEPVVGGWCDPAFDLVREEFTVNFAARAEHGAAVCVIVRGAVVVNLWGGWRDVAKRQPWAADTLVNVFSVGKGLLAACGARLTGQGLLDVDAPVARYWPEFSAAGKAAVTVRQLLSHQAAVPAIRRPLAPGSMLDWSLMTSVLADEEPWWPLGSGHGYHVNTLGFAVGEVIRRVTGMTPGTLLQRELAGPIAADVHIGLAASQHSRVAAFIWRQAQAAGSAPPVADDADMAVRAYVNPPDFSGSGVVNTAAWRSAEIPSANAHATASGVARFYAALADGGAVGGYRVADASALAAAAEEQVYGEDLVLRRPSRFGLGFQLTHPERPLGLGPRCFGHFGAGGSVGFCDPDAGLGFGYVTNQMGPRWRNPRNRALMDACYACL
jgi:CubicO group peptidase (beta-lactamase class C family)